MNIISSLKAGLGYIKSLRTKHSVIPEVKRLRQKDHYKFKVSLRTHANVFYGELKRERCYFLAAFTPSSITQVPGDSCSSTPAAPLLLPQLLPQRLSTSCRAFFSGQPSAVALATGRSSLVSLSAVLWPCTPRLGVLAASCLD